MSKGKRYKIPQSRMPFVNAEVSKARFQGEDHLVSSIWGGSSGGRIYFWNPDTGSKGMRELPGGVPGAYMLRTASDGCLYLGCGNGDLIRYDADADEFEFLVTGELTSITWGGCVTDRYAIWAASPGHVGVYDYLENRLVKVFRPIDSEEPPALYGHGAAEAPDGSVLLSIDVPQARFIVLDVESMNAISHTPPNIQGVGSTSDALFWDGDLAVFVRGELHVMSYPDFQLKETIPRPGNGGVGGRACLVGGRLYAYCNADGGLYVLDRAVGKWEVATSAWTEGGNTTIHAWGETDVCGVTVSGEVMRYNTVTGTTDRMDLESTGPMGAHALCAVPDKNLIVGAPFINQRFWTVNTDTGAGVDCGRAAPGGGQINQILWEPITQRALMSSYTTSTVTAYDPDAPVDWPNNPSVLASADREGQMRPMGLVHDGRHVWMATSPEYGTLGGALSRIDPKTGDIKIWRHLVPDQKVNAVLVDSDRRRVYCSTEIYGDANSAPPTQTTGQLVSFDMDGLKTLQIQPIEEGEGSVRVLAVLPSGEVLAQQKGLFYAWNAEKGEFRDLGSAPEGCRSAVLDPVTEQLWTSVEGSIGRLGLGAEGVTYVPVIQESGSYLHIVGRTLYYTTEFEVCEVCVDNISD